MNTIAVIIGTRNHNKQQITTAIFEQLSSQSVQLQTVDAPSGVEDAPFDADVYKGAFNRARYCQQQTSSDTAICVGLESGLVHREEVLFEETWAVLLHNKRQFVGYSSGLAVPDHIITRMEKHSLKHNEMMKLFDGEQGKNPNSDTWSSYTGDVLSRNTSLQEAVRNAAIQLFTNEDSLYNPTSKTKRNR